MRATATGRLKPRPEHPAEGCRQTTHSVDGRSGTTPSYEEGTTLNAGNSFARCSQTLAYAILQDLEVLTVQVGHISLRWVNDRHAERHEVDAGAKHWALRLSEQGFPAQSFRGASQRFGPETSHPQLDEALQGRIESLDVTVPAARLPRVDQTGDGRVRGIRSIDIAEHQRAGLHDAVDDRWDRRRSRRRRTARRGTRRWRASGWTAGAGRRRGVLELVEHLGQLRGGGSGPPGTMP